jgi:nitrite reductase/ring-hydroxylating ferredoxin subunit
MSFLFYEVCTEDELPAVGRGKRFEVEGYDLCIFNLNGTLHASGDACPHERVSLGDGATLDGEIITCGAHRWEFNVVTGECLEDASFPLRKFPVGRKDGVIYVGFPADETGELETVAQ